mmetsp:Transcript_40912/g.46484  ORF Transcript_40912/g.46484 Transcript_40912/m.46484 type:complete len:199 (-) Transcript_40912:197-793(-)
MFSESRLTESRLLAIETKIGLKPKIGDGLSNEKDIASRLIAIENKWKSSTLSSFNQTWDESDKLLDDLSPGAGITYQQILSGRSRCYPIFYRKQLVLASQDSLKEDMRQLSEILNLLYISQKSILKDVTQAPILHTQPLSHNDTRRLDRLRLKITQSHQQATSLANRMDSLISMYHKFMFNLSERMIFIEEKLDRSNN